MLDETNLKRRIGQTVRFYRHQRQWTQEELGRRTGMHRTYLTEVERGVRNVAVTGLARIAQAFDVPLGRFFTTAEKIVLDDRKSSSSRGKRVTPKPAATRRKPARSRR